MALLQFIFSSPWVYFGSLLLIIVSVGSFGMALALFLNAVKGK